MDPGRTASARPSRASQIRVIWSPHVVATSVPSGLNATPVIDSLCPPNLINSSFETRFQSTSERSATLAIVTPSGLKANAGSGTAAVSQSESGAFPVGGQELDRIILTLDGEPLAIGAEHEVPRIPHETSSQSAGACIVEVDAPVFPAHGQPTTLAIDRQLDGLGISTLDRAPGRRPAGSSEKDNALARARIASSPSGRNATCPPYKSLRSRGCC